MRALAIIQLFHIPHLRRATTTLGALLTIGIASLAVFPATLAAQTPDTNMLAPLWINALDGFELRPPLNCDVLQPKFQAPPPQKNGTLPVRPGNLVTFVNNSMRWGIIIHLSELKKDVPLKTLLDETVAEARHNYPKVRVLARRMITNSGKPAGILVLQLITASNNKPVMRQQLIIRAAPKLYYLLTFFSPAGQADGARACFSAMIKTFRLLNMAKLQQQRAAAVIAGRKWLKGITAEMLKKKAIHSHLYQIKVNGKDIGYVLVSCYPGAEDGYTGMFSATNARTFLTNGEVILSKVICFWAYAQQGKKPGPATHYTTWYKAIETLVPINNPQEVKMRQERIVIDPKTNKQILEHIKIPYPNMQIHWVRETGDEQSAYVPQLDKHGNPTDLFVRHRWMTVYMQRRHVLPGQPNKPTHFELPSYMPAYLPLTLKYFWPRLVNLAKPSAMGFVTFNSGSRRLGLRLLRVRGMQRITVNGHKIVARHLTEQLDPGIANLWVNSRGMLIKYLGSDGSEWTPTTAAAMNKKWKARLAALKQ
jgi:hypothetical protein